MQLRDTGFMAGTVRRIGRTVAAGLAAAVLAAVPSLAQAQTPADTLIVLDASESMWGQIQGRTKIEIARETLSTVLSEAAPGMNIGMIAYGHRVRGECSDIETLVPMGPAAQTVPRIIDAARAITPRGMTPLSDAVRKAAEEMLYTERAATVVLVTDGIETCDADPCALGMELNAAGIDFTAHVVGFGLTGDEGRQVACLADNTGGRYIAADDADQLVDALRRTIAPDDSDFVDVVDFDDSDFVDEPLATDRRRVEFTFRDMLGGPALKANELQIVIDPPTGGAYDDWRMWHHQRDFTAEGLFDPGTYLVSVSRRTDRVDLRARFEIDVPPGSDTLVVDRAIAARLKVNTLVHAGLRLEPGKGTPTANKSGLGYGVYELVPVRDGEPDYAATMAYGYRADLDVSVPPGDYVLRGTFARTFTRERLIRIAPGEHKEIDVDFGLARVDVDFRDADGFPPARPYTRVSDEPGGNAFFAAGRDVLNGERLPWYLPPGAWRMETGQESAGARRAELVVMVPGPGAAIPVRPTEGRRLDDADIAAMADEARVGCLGFGGTEHGRKACIIERADLSATTVDVPIDGLQVPASDTPIPPGIYALVERPGFDPANGADVGAAVAACVESPFIAYPDGHVQAKVFSPAADVTGVPYRTVVAGRCTAMDGGATCRIAPPESAGEAQAMDLGLTPLGGGHFRVVNRSRGNTEGALFLCVRPGGAMSATETLPDGRKLVDHIMARADGGPELGYADDGTYLGPKVSDPVTRPPAPEAGGDFGAIAGLYGRPLDRSAPLPLAGDDLLEACFVNGMVLYPDGFAQGFRENTMAMVADDQTAPPVPAMHMTCSGDARSATCAARGGAYPGGEPVPVPIELTAMPDDLIRICVDADCFQMQRCRDPRSAFADMPPAPDGRHWLDHVLPRPDAGPGIE